MANGRDPADRDTDDGLIRRVAQGDAAAWPLLVDRHLSSIVGYAWYMLGDRAEAEDVGQETLVRFLRKAPDWKSGGPKLRTWLYRVAINLCIDRKRRQRPVSLDSLAEDGVVPLHAVTTDRMDQRIAVRTALDGLPDRQKMAIILVHYQGFTGREAAGLMDSSEDALESLLARARRALRRQLEPAMNDLLGASG